MFTGLIEEMGEVVSLAKSGRALKVRVSLKDVKAGDSISVNGVCLTAVSIEGDVLGFDLSEETLKSTGMGGLRPGERVNIESSLRADGKLGGHFVTGHVDTVGRIRKKTKSDGGLKVAIGIPGQWADLLVPKGSVAVDGISLTVVDVLGEGFTVVIIPHTGAVTTIGLKKTGQAVNIETDIIGKYVKRLLAKGVGGPGRFEEGALMETLKRQGFA